MNINGYIKSVSDKSFAEMPFNDVDALIFAEFSYLNLELLPIKEGGSFYLKDFPKDMINPLCDNQMDAKFNKTMLHLMLESKRYQDIYVKYVAQLDSDEEICQFFAVTIFFEDKMYISFRGTDLTLRGWKEDLSMCFSPLVPSQTYAYQYLKEVLLLEKDRSYYVGGHSKGGNLALYASVKIDDEFNIRLIKTYSFDGPGFYDNNVVDQIDGWKYKNKIVKIMPKNALVGILLNNNITGTIVDATSTGVFQHDPFRWKVNELGLFNVYKYRLRRSFINEYVLSQWLSEMDVKDKKLIINLLFDSFDSLNISVLALKKEWWSTVRKIIKSYRKLIKRDKQRFRKLVARLFSLNGRATFGFTKKK